MIPLSTDASPVPAGMKVQAPKRIQSPFPGLAQGCTGNVQGHTSIKTGPEGVCDLIRLCLNLQI